MDGRQALTTIGTVILGADGQYVYVVQREENMIRVFDSRSGKLIHTIGRDGAGPGEFKGLGRIGWKQDTLFAVDVALQRVSLFSPSGEHFRTERIVSAPIPAIGRPAIPAILTESGEVIGEPFVSMAGVANGDITSVPMVLMTRTGAVIRTLAIRNVRNTISKVAAGNRVLFFVQPMSDPSLKSFAPDGSSLVIVDQSVSEDRVATFLVTRIKSTGDTLYHRAYRYTPRPIPSQVADSIHDFYVEAFTRGRIPRARQVVEEAIALPRMQLPVSAVVHGSDGSTWIRREDRGSASVVWLVLNAEGGIRATVYAPPGLTLLALGTGSVWGTVRDDLDVPYLVRYRVRRLVR
jgi:hypothetical protein